MPAMINSLFTEIYCPNIAYNKIQLISYPISYHNSCLYFAIHSFHHPNNIYLFYYFSTLSYYFSTLYYYNDFLDVLVHATFIILLL